MLGTIAAMNSLMTRNCKVKVCSIHVLICVVSATSACVVGGEADDGPTSTPSAEAFNESDVGTCAIRGQKRVYSSCFTQEGGPIGWYSSEVQDYVEDKIEMRSECEVECSNIAMVNVCGFSDFTTCKATFSLERVPECRVVNDFCPDYNPYVSPLTPVSGYDACVALARARLNLCQTNLVEALYIGTPNQPGNANIRVTQ